MELIERVDEAAAYDVKVSSFGGKPVSGILILPEKADAKSCPAEICYVGYGIHGVARPSQEMIRSCHNKIYFNINAHGIDNFRDEAYHASLGLNGYGFFHNEKPETSYFFGMFHR